MPRSETVAQILESAGEVFARKGFTQATVREICAAAGVNVAAINYHFGDKERLYIEAVKEARNVIEARVPLPEAEDHEPEEVLSHLIRTLAQRLLSRDVEAWRHQLLMREFTNPSRACEEMMQESIVPFLERLHAVLRRLLPPNVPEATVRQFGFSIIAQCAYYRLQDRVVSMLVPPEEFTAHYGVEQLADHIVRFSLAAIRAYDSVEGKV